MNTTDRRVRRTQKLLGDALVAIALEKDYDEITIQEITDRADIGYRTFFRHYSDKDALLNDVLSAVKDEMRGLMEPPPLELLMDPEAKAMGSTQSVVLFKHAKDNCDLYRVFLFSDRGLVQPLKQFAIEEFKANYGALLESDIPVDILVNHMVSGMITLLRWWLENDMCYSIEDMGDIAFRLIVIPIRDLIIQGSSE